MNSFQKRIMLFVIGCLGTRSLLVYLAKTLSPDFLQLMGYMAILPALGFLLIYFMGWRKTGAEVFGDKIWWNSLRPVHALLWAGFAVSAIQKSKSAWMFLLADVLLGASAFTYHHLAPKMFPLSV